MQWRSRVGHAKAGCALLEATARTSHHGLTLRVRSLSPLQGLSKVREPITTSAARCAREASLRVTPPPERQPAQCCLFAFHANAGCVLMATAHTSHQGLAPEERGLPLVTCHSILHRPIITSAARRARGKLTSFATSRKTARAVPPVRVPRECRVRVGCHGLHVAPRSCAERERPSATAVSFYST